MKFFLPIALVAMVALAGCRAPVPVQNLDNVKYGMSEYTPRKTLTLEDYERAIIRAGSERNWIFEPAGPGHLIGTNDIRGKHKAVVDVTFTTESFSIDYKNSQNLDYNANAGTIHPNYNNWVELLKADIQAEIQKMRAG